MSDSLSFKYTLTEGDVASAMHSQALRSRYLWVLLGLFALIVAYTFYGQIQAVLLGQRPWYSLAWTGLTFSVLGFAWWAFIWLYPYWVARRWPAIGVERELTVSSNGITSRSALGYSESSWANFTSVLETDEFFLLNMGRANYLPIPKHDFADTLAQDCFRELIRANIPDARRLA